MCKPGDRTMVEVHVDASVAAEGVAVYKAMPIDSCLAELVKIADDRGFRMLSSCCGHGKNDGHIWFARTASSGEGA